MNLEPFRVYGSTLISFSGGRTSAFMLRSVLDAHDGELPEDAVVIFANTGKERLETLEFVREIETRWDVPIVWIEYADVKGYRNQWKVVDYESAARNGEPFEALIKKMGYPPTPVARFCTQHLKVRAMLGYLNVELGWKELATFVGIRYDEPRRWKIRGIDEATHFLENDRQLPLVDAKVTLEDVDAFWAEQDFDLRLRPWEGNCDLCYLKGRSRIERILRDRPDLAEWWLEWERRTERPFRTDRPPFAKLLEKVTRQPLLPLAELEEEDDGTISCFCTD